MTAGLKHKVRRALGAGVSILALAACSTASAPFAGDAPRSVYGDYLAARWADARNHSGDAVSYYQRALEKEPESAFLAERAFFSALTSGDQAAAADFATRTMQTDPDNRLARLTLAADALAERRYNDTLMLLDQTTLGPFNRVVGSLLIAWAEAGKGNAQAALDAIAAPNESGAFASLSGLHYALILAKFERPGAEEAFQSAVETSALPSFAIREYGRWLERAGRVDEARSLYEDRLAESPNDAVTQAEMARLVSGQRPPAPVTAAEGAAIGVYGPAAALSTQEQTQLSQIYLEIALRLDPEFGPARVLLARLFSQDGRLAEADRLLAALQPNAASALEAEIIRAQIKLVQGDTETGIALLQEAWRRSGDRQAGQSLAEALRIAERWEEAETVSTTLIQRAGEAADGELYYGRGIARERQNKWPSARSDFRRALQQSPDDPEILNYLGYTMVERGENIDEAFGMIERAIMLRPRAGYIVDSLGWAHYKRGDYAEAVTHLERAVALEPADATINAHLGDAYWMTGRRLEARFQWERALSFDPEPSIEQELAEKLENGLNSTPSSMADTR